MRIAITGATGVIGQHLVEALDCAKIHLIGRSGKKLKALFENRPGRRCFEVDYSAASMETALKGVDAVVHLAAVRPDKSLTRFSNYAENIRTTANLFQACRKHGIANIVFISTASIYNPAINQVPFTEEERVSPSSYYAISKLTGENLSCLYGLNVKSLRLAPFIGLGERTQYMRMAFIQRAVGKKNLTIFGKGKGRREYIYAKDAVNAIRLALRKPNMSGIFNIGMGCSIDNLGYANLVNDVFCRGALDIRFAHEKSENGGHYLMSSEKTKEKLGFIPHYTLEKALMDLRASLKGENSRENPI